MQDHPHIVRSLGHYEDSEHIIVVSEYVEAEYLAYVIESRTFTEEEARSIIKQLFSALAYLHQNNIIHRNLTPNNNLFESTDNKIIVRIVGFTRAIIHDSLDKPVYEVLSLVMII